MSNQDIRNQKIDNRERDEALERLIDEAAIALAEETPGETVELEALGRVSARLGLSGSTSAGAAGVSGGELDSCEDYQAAMPAMLAGTLSEGRKLLIEDHSRHCVPCRRALMSLRSGQPLGLATERAAEPTRGWRQLVAAALIVGIALAGGWFLWQNTLPADQSELIQVRSIDGKMFRVADSGLERLYPGDWVDGGQEIRTAKNSAARVQLDDGSLVEINERSAFEALRKRSGTQIRVDRGSVIVEAADQRTGTLDVTTDELMVSVKGTIFSVHHGTKGSRVSVIEGEVRVEHGRKAQSLYPGDQFGSRATMAALPLAAEIGWSRNADQYLALLEEFKELRTSLNQVMAAAEPRFSSELLDLVPADATVYAALPNPTATLAEVYGLIRERLGSSAVLAEWWSQVEETGAVAHIDEFVGRVQELSSYLGEETVVALSLDEQAEPSSPLVLSQVVDADGLRAALEAQLAELRAEFPDLEVTIIDSSTTTVPAGADQLFIWIGESLLVASPEIAEINRIAAGQESGFSATPFGERVVAAYGQGAEYLGAVDLATIFAAVMDHEGDDSAEDRAALSFAGFESIQYLVVERHQDEERAHTAAELTFDGERTGLAAWLAEPGPMGALEFFSPDASFVTAVVMQDPLSMLDEVLDFARTQEDDETESGHGVDDGLDIFADETGLDLREDLVAPLGGEFAFGIDGPALPVPSWKAVVEVYDEVRLQTTIETLIGRASAEGVVVAVSETVVDGRTFYSLSGDLPEGSPVDGMTTHYTYVDGYLVMAPSTALLEQAIQYRDSGTAITATAGFQELLPTDSYLDFSAVAYNRIGETLSSLVDKLPRPDGLTEDQQQQFDSLIGELTQSSGPSLYCLYGEDQRIRLVSNSPSMVPFSGLGSVFGLGAMMSNLDLESLGDMNW